MFRRFPVNSAGREGLIEKPAAKEAKWHSQKLDMALVRRVRQVAIERFRRLSEESPELFELAASSMPGLGGAP